MTNKSSVGELSRPVNIEEVCARLAGFRSPQAAAAVSELRARPDDVFISTYSKSGTTWMQQIVHQLRSGCSTDFEEISCVVPWLESAVDMNIDPHADQPFRFRAFKCHLLHKDLPVGGRYITVFRDPIDVLSSFYRFFEGWWFEEGSINIDEFAATLYIQGSAAGRHWDHLVDWWHKIDSEDTLVLCYEDMLLAPDKAVEVVADFLKLDISDAALQCAVNNCSREYMLKNSHQFDEHVLRDIRDPVWGLPPGGASGKVAGKSHASSKPSDETLRALDDVWQKTVGQSLGFEHYAAFRGALPNVLGVVRG